MAVAPAGNDVSGGPLHALRVKIREDVVVGLALGALCDGTRNILGL